MTTEQAMIEHGAMLVVKTVSKTRLAMRDVHGHWTVTEGARSGRGRTRILYNTHDDAVADESAALLSLLDGRPR
jgi:hypothetical protein